MLERFRALEIDPRSEAVEFKYTRMGPRGNDIVRGAIMPARGYLSQSESAVTIGLGDRGSVGKVRIRWPDGSAQDVDHVAVDSTTRVIQPR
jgi:ASPIC/UnbV protein